ncbi:hypothetical protein BDV3_001627 [Batrachochytrium dendrobatidis]
MLLRSIPPPSWSDGIPTAAPPFPFKVADPSTLLSLLVFLTPPVSKYYLENPSKCYIDSSSNYVVDSKKHDGIHILPDATLAALPRSYILWEASSSHGVQLCIVGHPSGRPFDPPSEFLPHLLWLIQVQNGKPSKKCQCCLCQSIDETLITGTPSAISSDITTPLLATAPMLHVVPSASQSHLPSYQQAVSQVQPFAHSQVQLLDHKLQHQAFQRSNISSIHSPGNIAITNPTQSSFSTTTMPAFQGQWFCDDANGGSASTGVRSNILTSASTFLTQANPLQISQPAHLQYQLNQAKQIQRQLSNSTSTFPSTPNTVQTSSTHILQPSLLGGMSHTPHSTSTPVHGGSSLMNAMTTGFSTPMAALTPIQGVSTASPAMIQMNHYNSMPISAGISSRPDLTQKQWMQSPLSPTASQPHTNGSIVNSVHEEEAHSDSNQDKKENEPMQSRSLGQHVSTCHASTTASRSPVLNSMNTIDEKQVKYKRKYVALKALVQISDHKIKRYTNSLAKARQKIAKLKLERRVLLQMFLIRDNDKYNGDLTPTDEEDDGESSHSEESFEDVEIEADERQTRHAKSDSDEDESEHDEEDGGEEDDIALDEITKVLIKPKTPRRKRPKLLDPNAPKRPANAFMLFCDLQRENLKEERKELQKNMPGSEQEIALSNLTKALGHRWRGLTESERKYYQNLFKEQVKQYDLELSNYFREHPDAAEAITNGTHISQALHNGGTEGGDESVIDANAPKKPVNSFHVFCETERDLIKQERKRLKATHGGTEEDAGHVHINKELGLKWRALSDADRKVYTDKFKELLAVHNEYMEHRYNGDGKKEGGNMSTEALQSNTASSVISKTNTIQASSPKNKTIAVAINNAEANTDTQSSDILDSFTIDSNKAGTVSEAQSDAGMISLEEFELDTAKIENRRHSSTETWSHGDRNDCGNTDEESSQQEAQNADEDKHEKDDLEDGIQEENIGFVDLSEMDLDSEMVDDATDELEAME